MVRAWYVNEKEVADDQRNPAVGNAVELNELKEIGVEYFKVWLDDHVCVQYCQGNAFLPLCSVQTSCVSRKGSYVFCWTLP